MPGPPLTSSSRTETERSLRSNTLLRDLSSDSFDERVLAAAGAPPPPLSSSSSSSLPSSRRATLGTYDTEHSSATPNPNPIAHLPTFPRRSYTVSGSNSTEEAIATIRLLRMRLKRSSQELLDLEHQLSQDRERNKKERERRVAEHMRLQMARRESIQSWTARVLEGSEKVKMWERESRERMRLREEKREREWEKESRERGRSVIGRRKKTVNWEHRTAYPIGSHMADGTRGDGGRWGRREQRQFEEPDSMVDGEEDYVDTTWRGTLPSGGLVGWVMGGGAAAAYNLLPSVLQAPLQRAQQNRRASLSVNYFKSILTSVTSFFQLPARPYSPKTTQVPRKPKKYVLQTAEFYGADFSAPPENEELAELEQRRVVHGSEGCEGEEGKLRLEQGSVFISAMSNIVQTKTDDWDKYRDGKGDGGGSLAVSRRPSVVGIVPLVGGEPLTRDDLPGTSGAGAGAGALLAPPKPWSEIVRERAPAIDYSDVFPSYVGKSEGVTVFRIESLNPAILPDDEVGTFCIADCYIILETRSRDDTRSRRRRGYGDDEDSNDEGDLEHRIWTWIGSEAEMDKRFCSAMFGVGLRNWLGVKESVQREAENEESAAFLSLFSPQIRYADPTHATESGLFVAQTRRYPLRLYRLVGKTSINLLLVEPKYWSLRPGSVFLLDWGREIWQWNGKGATLQHRMKCRMLIDRINSLERGGKAEIEEIDEGSEVPHFWEILGGERTEEDANEEAAADAEETEETMFRRIASQPPVLYRALEDLSDDVLSHTVSHGKLKRGMLVSDGCYVLDAGVELFIWIGKSTTLACRQAATELLARIVPLQKRPKWVGLNKFAEDHETEVFKLRFPDWEVNSVDINWQEIKQGEAAIPTAPRSAPSKIRVDARALYAPPPPNDSQTHPVLEDTISHANELLQSFSCFVYQKGRFVQVPDEERGHFFTDNAYVFLCVYRLEEEKERELREARERRRVERRKQRLRISGA
ncbi:hypothetical protein HK104_007716, partial [Borealophlyctis nickersoniae]